MVWKNPAGFRALICAWYKFIVKQTKICTWQSVRVESRDKSPVQLSNKYISSSKKRLCTDGVKYLFGWQCNIKCLSFFESNVNTTYHILFQDLLTTKTRWLKNKKRWPKNSKGTWIKKFEDKRRQSDLTIKRQGQNNNSDRQQKKDDQKKHRTHEIRFKKIWLRL